MSKEKIQKYLKNKGISVIFETPKNPKHGDFAFACFNLAKEQGRNSVEIAKELSIELQKEFSSLKINSVGHYVNFLLDRADLTEKVISEILEKKEKYGSLNINETALIEHTSINPNASPHLGRARNALIGDSLAGLLKFNGYKTEVHYFVNDVGKQIAVLVYGTKNNSDLNFDDLLGEYIKINKKLEENPELEKEIFELLSKFESGDKKTIDSFRKVVDICIKGQIRILSEIGINYDFFDYESDFLFNKNIDDVLKRIKKTNKTFIDEDERLVLDLKEFNLPLKSPVLVLTRKDKTSLYTLRDLAYTVWKNERQCKKNIVVLGEDHKSYFKQLASTLKLINEPSPEVVHYSFILLTDEKMSTRKGHVVLLTDFLDEAKKRAKEEILKREHDYSEGETEEISKAVGYGAAKFSILKISPEKNVLFDWEQSLSFEGETAPYVQYAYARIKSILRKEFNNEKVDFSLLKKNEEIDLIKELYDFPELIKKADESLKVHLIALKTYQIAKKFNEFYHACPVLVADTSELKNARLALIESVSIVIKIGLNIIGINVVERM